MATVSSKQTTDRETAFQAATDNVWFEMSDAARRQRMQWWRQASESRSDRLEYVANLEMQMELALGKKNLGYEFDY